MSFRASDLQNLVNEHGSVVTLRSNTTGVYNPSTGTVSVSSSDVSVKAYFGNYMLDEINGSSIVEGDRKIVLNTITTSGTTTPEPKVDDLIVGEGDTVSIKNIQKIKSSGVVVAYICQVRE